MDLEETPESQELAAQQSLREYWNERLTEFEAVIYPVFYTRGYSKNTALLAVMMDELDDSLVVAAAAARRLEDGGA